MQWYGRISLLNLGYLSQAGWVIGLILGKYLGVLFCLGSAVFFITTEWLQRMFKEDEKTRKRFVILLVSNVLASLAFALSTVLCVIAHAVLFCFWLDFLFSLKPHSGQ